MVPQVEVLRHITDVHCHPTDSEISTEEMMALPITICAMATRQSDQILVAELARAYPQKVIPCFGYHPWFTHWISIEPGMPQSKEVHYHNLFLGTQNSSVSHPGTPELTKLLDQMIPFLPDPISLVDVVSDLRQNLVQFPTAMLGEVGLDRSARVPIDYRSEQRTLSPFTIPFQHQLAVVEAQLELAIELKRNVSFHSVKAQMATLDLLNSLKKKHGSAWTQISFDLHSCGLSPEMWRDIEKTHCNVFLSLSTIINARSPSHEKLISAASPSRLLVESDIHEIGQCTERTWNILCTIGRVKGWAVEETWEEDAENFCHGTVHKLEENWRRFTRGEHVTST